MTPKLCKHGLPNLTEYTCKKCVLKWLKEISAQTDRLTKEWSKSKFG